MSLPNAGVFSGVFNPKADHAYVDEFYSERRNRYEEDHDLYLDTTSRAFFVVESTEHESGPSTSYHHTIRHLNDVELQQLLTEHSEMQVKANMLLERIQS